MTHHVLFKVTYRTICQNRSTRGGIVCLSHESKPPEDPISDARLLFPFSPEVPLPAPVYVSMHSLLRVVTIIIGVGVTADFSDDTIRTYTIVNCAGTAKAPSRAVEVKTKPYFRSCLESKAELRVSFRITHRANEHGKNKHFRERTVVVLTLHLDSPFQGE